MYLTTALAIPVLGGDIQTSLKKQPTRDCPYTGNLQRTNKKNKMSTQKKRKKIKNKLEIQDQSVVVGRGEGVWWNRGWQFNASLPSS